MLKLKSLRFSGIGRFVETQDVKFDGLGNLVQVDAENRNTGGSSGTGKTTLFNALDYLLGLNDLPTTVLQSRMTKEPLSVRGEFDFNGKPLLITRNKKGLIIDLDDQVTEGSSKLSEEKLDEILGMPRDLFRKILHKRQKEGGFFLEFTPKKMYEFLTDALNLSETRKKQEIVENQLKTLENSKNVLQNSHFATLSALKATQENILSLGIAPIRDIHQAVILELKSKFDASQAALAKLEAEQASDEVALTAQRPALIPNPVLEPVPQLPEPELLSTELDNASTITLLEAKLGSLSKEIADLKEKENFRVRTVTQAIQERRLTVQMLQHKCSLAHTAKDEATKLAGEIKKIRDAICPTCEQAWVTESAKIKETELLNRLTAFKEQIKEGAYSEQLAVTTKMEMEVLEKELAPQELDIIMAKNTEIVHYNEQIAQEKQKAKDYKEQITNQNMELLKVHQTKQAELSIGVNARNAALLADVSAKNKTAQDDYQNRVTAIRVIQKRDMDQARGQAEVDRRAFEAAVTKLKMYEDARSRYESSLTQMKAKEVELQKTLEGYNENLAKVTIELQLAEELKKAIKTFLSVSFDDALESVSDAATKIIRCIPTMSNATIQFEGQKETKEGKVKEEVNAVLSMDGEIGIPIKSLSGGERSSVDLAVDLAVIDFIESETGKGIDVFILDEPFTGLDTVSIEMALEVLKNSNSNKKLIIVDHNPEVKQMVSNRIVVVRDGLTSSISSQEGLNG